MLGFWNIFSIFFLNVVYYDANRLLHIKKMNGNHDEDNNEIVQCSLASLLCQHKHFSEIAHFVSIINRVFYLICSWFFFYFFNHLAFFHSMINNVERTAPSYHRYSLLLFVMMTKVVQHTYLPSLSRLYTCTHKNRWDSTFHVNTPWNWNI